MDERDPMILARNVRAFRVLRGWSMRDLSKQSGLSLQTIVNVEAGRGCNALSEERFASGFNTYIGRLWEADLLCDKKQRPIDTSKGRWFFGELDHAQQYFRRHRPEVDRFRTDPDSIQTRVERHRLGHSFGWNFLRPLGGGVGDVYFMYNVAELFAGGLNVGRERPFTLLIQAHSGNFRIKVRGEEFEVFEENSIVLEHSDPYWLEPLHPVRHGERPPMLHLIYLDTLSLQK